MKYKKLLVICGPTATGKTKLALSLAKGFDGELVSADSRQVYRGMDIGTGKDLPQQLPMNNLQLTIAFRNRTYHVVPYNASDIPVWMYDVVNPDEPFSVAHYHNLASAVCHDIWERGKLPIVVGGTGLYIRAITDGIATIDIPQDNVLRKSLSKLTFSTLQQKLMAVDLKRWGALNASDSHNPRRLIRKIEIALHGGGEKKDEKEPNDTEMIGLILPLKELYRRIDVRVDNRVIEGIIDEIARLREKGYGWSLPSMSAMGYRKWRIFFENAEDSGLREHAIQQWKFDEHAYARRQMTWFKRLKDIQWFDGTQTQWESKVEARVASWYTGN